MKKKSHLTQDQRYEIQTYMKMNVRPAEIARQIGKKPFGDQPRDQAQQWSPEQIKGHADINGIPMVSHETVYKLMMIDKTHGDDLYKTVVTGSSTGLDR